MRELGRRVARGAGFALLGLGLLGMGALGGGGGQGTMMTRDFHATLTDVDGTRIAVSRVNVGGEASIEGDVGRGRLRIPFESITSIRFAPIGQDRDRVRAEVVLREGEPATLTVRGAATFYGQTSSGSYQIRARDLRTVDFAQE